MGGLFHPTEEPKASVGSEHFATLTFTAKGSGSASLTFSCTTDGGIVCCTNDEVNSGTCQAERLCINSSILSIEAVGFVNYIACSKLVDGHYTVRGEGDGTRTFPLETPLPGEPVCDLCGFCKEREKPDNWKACMNCIDQGNRSWTPIGCVSTNTVGFVQAILSFLLPLVGGLAFLGIIYGGFLLLTSSGDALRISHGKSIFMGSIGALLLIVFSIFLLKLIGFEILGILEMSFSGLLG